MRTCLTALCLAGLLLLGGCGVGHVEGSSLPVYYLDQAEDGAKALKTETRTLDSDTEAVEGLLLALLEGPQAENLAPAIPSGVNLRGWTLSNGLLTVDLSARYGRLSGIDLTLADYSIVLTLTQLEEVEAVMITVEGKLLAYRDHQRLTAQDVQERILQEEKPCARTAA